jgi:hypothetical protein
MFTDKEWTILEGLVRRRSLNLQKQLERQRSELSQEKYNEYSIPINDLLTIYDKVQKARKETSKLAS